MAALTIGAPSTVTSASTTGSVLNSSATTDVVVLRAAVANAHASATQYAALVEGVTAVPAVGTLAGLPLIQVTTVGAGSTAIMDFGVSGYHTSGACVLVGLSSLTPPTYCASDMSFVSYVSTIS